MLTLKQCENIIKNGIRFELSKNKKYVKVYKNNDFKGTIYASDTPVYFCGNEFVETTGKEVVDFFKNISYFM